MNRKKIFSTILFAAGLALMQCSCAKNTFLAVSLHHKEGGIYKFGPKGEVLHALHAPTLNYLIRSRKRPLLYGSLPRPLKLTSYSGAVLVARELPGGFLHLVQCASAGGKHPCHLTLSPDEKFLYTANYASGDISELPLDRDGSICGMARIIPHKGKSITSRQKGPHPHYVSFDPAGKHLYACDLGTDEIRIYDYIPGKGLQQPCEAVLKLVPGSGVRHLVFSPDGKTLYTANELNSTSTSFYRKDLSSPWKEVKTLSTRQKNAPGKKNYPGAIKITSDGKYFFITNRGDDTLAVFKTLPGGDFTLLKTVPSGGKYPSDILLLPGEKILAVIHLKDHKITCFDLDVKNGTLRKRKEENTVRSGITLSL